MKTMNKIEKPLTSDRLKQHQLLAIITLIIITFASCNQAGLKEQKAIDTIHVMVSILPQKYFVEQIAGNKAVVSVLIPPGSNPHVYDPTPRQMEEISRTEIYFMIGYLGFEQVLKSSLIDNYPNLKMYNQSSGVNLMGHEGEACEHAEHQPDESGIDPHTWLSPKNVLVMAKTTLDNLIENSPENAQAFTENYEQFIRKINLLDYKIDSILENLPSRKFMIFHPSLAYFAKDYNLIQIPIEFEGKEPAPARLKDAVAAAKSSGIHVIFIQKEFDAENAKIIANEIQGKVAQIDPLSADWEENLIQIAQSIKDSFYDTNQN